MVEGGGRKAAESAQGASFEDAERLHARRENGDGLRPVCRYEPEGGAGAGA